MSARADHLAIAARVPEGARVLDVGCADGELMALLKAERGARVSGLEVSEALVSRALARGLSVIQGDADTALAAWPTDAFDVAILSKTIQEMREPAHLLRELSRIAPEIILSFRNYGYWRRRLSLLATGRMPSPSGGDWHEAAALHPCTVRDMVALAESVDLELVAMAGVAGDGSVRFRARGLKRLNWHAPEAILHLRRTASPGTGAGSRHAHA